MNAATYKNRAVGKLYALKDGYQSTYSRPKLSINKVAANSYHRAGDAADVKKGLPQTKDQNRTIWISGGIALGLIILLVLAVKYKFIKL